MLRTIKNASKPSFVSQKIFSGNSVAIYEIQPVLMLDKLIYAVFGYFRFKQIVNVWISLKIHKNKTWYLQTQPV